MEAKKRIGILTGGGDCPGLNAAIRAATKTALKLDYDVIGIRDGWEGLLFDRTEVLDRPRVSGIIDRGGTILGASRTSPFHVENGPQRVSDAVEKLGLSGVVVLGGEGTLSATSRLATMGLPVVGIPKTIDNDVKETDFSIGFQTAVQVAMDALDRLRTTGESHHRVMILEVMGHRTGWIATYAGMSSGADAILIPEIPVDENNMTELCQILEERSQKGMKFSVVVVAEGVELLGKTITRLGFHTGEAQNADRLGGAGEALSELIEQRTGLHARVSSLDYIQRGGSPVAYDRSLATAFGVKAIELITKKKFGVMTSLKGNRVTSVPLDKMADGIKCVDLGAFKTAKIFFG